MPVQKVLSIAPVLNLFPEFPPLPKTDHLLKKAWKTATELGMVTEIQWKSYEYTRTDRFCAACYPGADDDFLEFCIDVNNFGWCMDDRADNVDGDLRCDRSLHKSVVASFLKVTRAARGVDPGNEDAVDEDKQLPFLKYLVSRSKLLCPNLYLFQEMMLAIEEYCLALLDVAPCSQESSPSVIYSIYFATRGSGSTEPLFRVLTRIHAAKQNIELTNFNPLIFQDKDILRLENLNSLACTFFNDAVSYDRELATSTSQENMVVLQQELRHCDQETALKQVIRMTIDIVNEFHDIVKRRKEAGTLCPLLEEYAKGLMEMFQGSIQWSLRCRRYISPTQIFVEYRDFTEDSCQCSDLQSI